MIPYTTIPFVSAFFLVMVGVLIGQLFWSRFRSEHQIVILRLRKKIRQQRQEIKQCTDKFSALQDHAKETAQVADEQAQSLQHVRDELQHLQIGYKAASAQLAEELQARRDLTVCLQDEQQRRERDVEKLQTALTAANKQFRAEQEARVDLERQLARLAADLESAHRDGEHLRIRLTEQVEFAEACQRSQQEIQGQHDALVDKSRLLRDRIGQLEQSSDLLRREQSTLEEQNRLLNQQLQTADNTIQQLTSQLQALQTDHDHLYLQRDDHAVALTRAEQVRQHVQQQLDDARLQLERLAWESAVKDQRFTSLQNDNEDLSTQLIRAARSQDELTKQYDQIQGELAESQHLLNECRSELEAAHRWRGDAERMALDLSQRREEVADRERQIALLQSRINDLQSEKDALELQQSELAERSQSTSAALEQAQAKQQHWQTIVEKTKGQLENARREIDRLAHVEDQMVEMDAGLRQTKDELKRIRRERDDAREIESATRLVVAELRDELNERLDAIEALRREREATAQPIGIRNPAAKTNRRSVDAS